MRRIRMTTAENGKWIHVDDELPPHDGTYEVTNAPQREDWPELSSTAFYDGCGFMVISGIYSTPRYWRHCVKLKKRYGKVSK